MSQSHTNWEQHPVEDRSRPSPPDEEYLPSQGFESTPPRQRLTEAPASSTTSNTIHRGKVIKPNKIYVGGLPDDTRAQDLRSCFGEVGEIIDIEQKVGFAFIEFTTREAAEESVRKYHEGSFMGNRIRVELSHGGGKNTARAVEPGACFKCGQQGHWARECNTYGTSQGHSRAAQPPPGGYAPPRDYYRSGSPPPDSRSYSRPLGPRYDYPPPSRSYSGYPSRYDAPPPPSSYGPDYYRHNPEYGRDYHPPTSPRDYQPGPPYPREYPSYPSRRTPPPRTYDERQPTYVRDYPSEYASRGRDPGRYAEEYGPPAGLRRRSHSPAQRSGTYSSQTAGYDSRSPYATTASHDTYASGSGYPASGDSRTGAPSSSAGYGRGA